MQRFYEYSGVELLDGREYLEVLQARTAHHPAHSYLEALLRVAEDAYAAASGHPTLAITQLHGDLSPTQIHKRRSEWALIDFGGSTRGPLLKDIFLFQLRRATLPGFWSWLRGEANRELMHPRDSAYLNLYARWQYSWSRRPLDEHALRFELLTFLLDSLSKKNTWPPKGNYHKHLATSLLDPTDGSK